MYNVSLILHICTESVLRFFQMVNFLIKVILVWRNLFSFYPPKNKLSLQHVTTVLQICVFWYSNPCVNQTKAANISFRIPQMRLCTPHLGTSYQFSMYLYLQRIRTMCRKKKTFILIHFHFYDSISLLWRIYIPSSLSLSLLATYKKFPLLWIPIYLISPWKNDIKNIF